MTLAELRAALAKLDHLPGDTPVIMQRDAEGNGYSPLNDTYQAMYEPETTWSGDMYPLPGQDDEWPAPANAVHAVFLEPVN